MRGPALTGMVLTTPLLLVLTLTFLSLLMLTLLPGLLLALAILGLLTLMLLPGLLLALGILGLLTLMLLPGLLSLPLLWLTICLPLGLRSLLTLAIRGLLFSTRFRPLRLSLLSLAGTLPFRFSFAMRLTIAIAFLRLTSIVTIVTRCCDSR